MWMVAMFDLPVVAEEDRKAAAAFRKSLLTRGFTMLQYSVYARFCRSEEFAKGVGDEIRGLLPGSGQVRLVMITDRQFGKMEVFDGKNRAAGERPQPQLMLF